MKDALQEILDRQLVAQEKHGYHFERMNHIVLTEYIKEYALHTQVELGEMLMELPYFKPWKVYPERYIDHIDMYDRARKEFIDAFHFMINIALALGFNSDMLLQMFIDKNDINRCRQTQPQYKPCQEDKV